MPTRFLRAALLSLLACGVGMPLLGHAEIYTWVDPAGVINLSNLAPPDGVRVTRVTHEAAPRVPSASEVARDAAREAASRTRRSQTVPGSSRCRRYPIAFASSSARSKSAGRPQRRWPIRSCRRRPWCSTPPNLRHRRTRAAIPRGPDAGSGGVQGSTRGLSSWAFRAVADSTTRSAGGRTTSCRGRRPSSPCSRCACLARPPPVCAASRTGRFRPPVVTSGRRVDLSRIKDARLQSQLSAPPV